MFDSDTVAFKALFGTFMKEIGLSQIDYSEKALIEIINSGGCKLPNIAAIVGGVASQEIIKILTKQYEILDNLVVFNGVHSTFSKYKV